MAWEAKAKSKNPKVQEMADKVLDILQIALQPFHDEAVAKKYFDPMKLKNVDFIVGLLKDTSNLLDDDTNQYSKLSEEELIARINQFNQ